MSTESPENKRKFSNSGDLRLTLGEHLEEIRQRLIRSFIYVTVGSIVGWVLAPKFWELINKSVIAPLNTPEHPIDLRIGVTEGFTFWIRLAVTIGLVLVIPLLVYEIWGFVKPGLKPNERKPIERVVPISVFLFFVGAGLGWWILPPTMAWFLSMTMAFEGTTIMQDAPDIVYFCSKMVLAFGISFQLPLIVYFLARIGLISADTIWRYWRQVTVGVFFTAAVITPSGDPFSMMVMALPMTGLFFASITAAKISSKKDTAKDDVLNNLD